MTPVASSDVYYGSNARRTARGTVVVAMSGGVDSAVAAALLERQGYDVVGITLQIWQEHAEESRHGGCCSLGAVEDARRAANVLGIPHYVLNFRDYFARQVIDKFASEYARGRTPNPCVECNRTVKFDELLRQARALGADYLATGHYARVQLNGTTGRYELMRARHAAKDQSYALYSLTQDQLSSVLMPLGDLGSKAETREIAREAGLALADKPESQDICFVPKEGYVRFLQERAGNESRQGNIVDTDGHVVGRHAGIVNYTIGQRRRLPASGGGALYVVDIDADTDTIVVGHDADLLRSEFIATDVNWISIADLDTPLAVSTRIRYNAGAESAEIRPGEELGTVLCAFRRPQRAITPGQAAVFYSGDVVVGGGTIDTVTAGA